MEKEKNNLSKNSVQKQDEKNKAKKKKVGIVTGIVGLSVAAAIAATVGARSCAPGENSYTITYFVDDEFAQGGSFSVKEGTSIGDLKSQLAPLDGYEVDGFYRDKDFSIEYGDNDKVTGDAEIYVKYKEIEAVVRFYKSKDLIAGGAGTEGDIKEVKVKYSEKITEQDLLGVERERESNGMRYTFTGWHTVMEDESGHFLTEDELIGKTGKELIALDADGDRQLDLFAVYSAEFIDYSLNFDSEYVSVKRDGAELNAEDIIHFGDKIEITLNASVGHRPSSLKINGEERITEFKENKLTFTAQGDVNILYAEELLEFSVKYYRENGESFSSETVKYNESAKYGETPTKDSDNTYTYEFKKWVDKTTGEDVDLEHIKGDLELKPEFEATYIEYKITDIPSGVTITRFRAGDGKGGKQLKKTDTLHYGDQIEVKYTLTEGHKLRFFDVQGATQADGKYSVIGDLTVVFEEELIAFRIGEYEGVKVYRGETVSESNLLRFDDEVKWGEKVTIVYVLKEGYKFKSLSINGKADYTESDKQVTIQVVQELAIEFESEIITLKVVYYAEDGVQELYSETVDYGEAAQYSKIPSKEADRANTYTFSKWVDRDTGAEVDLQSIKKDINVKASFTAKAIDYSLSFDDDIFDVKRDGHLLTPSDKVHYGETIVVEFMGRDGYTRTMKVSGMDGDEFSSGSEFTVNGDVTIEAVDKANEYKLGTIPSGVTVTVERGDDTVSLKSGASIFYDEVLTVKYTLIEHYHLTKFTIAGESRITENEVSHIVRGEFDIEFEQAIDTYTVEFFDEYKDGSADSLGSVVVNWNEKASHDAPSKDSDKEFDYEFLYWADEEGEEVDLSHVTEDKKVYAKYRANFIEYSLTIETNKNVTVSVYLVKEQETPLASGKTVHYGDVLKVVYQVQEGYLLSVFTVNGVDVEGHENNHIFSVDGHTTIRVEASESKVKFGDLQKNIPDGVTLKKSDGSAFSEDDEITWGDEVIVSYELEEGKQKDKFVVNGQECENDYKFEFKGRVDVTFEQSYIKYKVRFYDDDGEKLLGEVEVEWGKDAQFNSPQQKQDETYIYEFSKWVTTLNGEEEADLTNIKSEKSVYASYTKKYIEYEVTFDNTKVKVSKDGADFASGNTAHYGDKLVITAIEKTGYNRSLEVSGADSEDGGYTVKGNVNIIVTDTAKEYSLQTVPEGVTVKVSRDGAEVPVSAGEKIYYDEVITVTFENRVGFNRSITVNGATGGGTASGSKFTVTGNVEIILNEEYIEYRLTINNSSEGTVEVYNQTQGKSVQNGDTVHYGDKLQISYHESLGHSMSKFEVVGASQEAGVYTASGEITITYEEEYTTYSYDSFQLPNGVSVSRDGEPLNSGDTLTWGEQLTVTYTESHESKEKDVFTVNGEAQENNYTFDFHGELEVEYTEKTKKFTITFYDENGENPEYEEVEWGNGISHQDPSKEADVRYTYEFLGWYSDKDGGDVVDLRSVKQSASVYARYRSIDVKYFISFSEDIAERISVKKGEENLNNGDYVLYDDEITVSYTLSDGHKLVYFKVNGDEVESGHTFRVHEQVSIEFEETIITYSIGNIDGITLYRGNSTEDSAKLSAGDLITWGEEITIVYNLSEGFEFDSLSINGQSYSSENTKIVITVTKELEINFQQKLKQLTVEFFDEDGSPLGSEIVTWNEGITQPNPTKSDKTYTYTFDNWYSSQEGGEVVDLTHVKENVKVYARYTKEFIEYVVNFRDYNGDLLFSDSVHYQEAAEPERTPTRDMDNYYSYVFDKWVTAKGGDIEADLSEILESKDVFASYTATYREYTLTFGENLRVKKGEQSLESGSTLHYDDVFMVEFDERLGYSRAISVTGVVGSGTSSGSSFKVAGNVEITLNEVQIEYTVKLNNNSESEVKIFNETQNKAVVPNETTVHYGDRLRVTYSVSEGHTLQEFSVTGADRENDSDIYVVNGSVVITYTEVLSSVDFDSLNIPEGVTVKDHSGKTLGSGDTLTWGEDITVSYNLSTGKEKKSFKVNDLECENDYNFQFEGRLNVEFVEDWIEYTVKFYNGEEVFETVMVKYGQTAATTLGDPAKAEDVIYRYEFAHWASTNGGSDEADLSNITSDRNFYAYYNSIYIEYEVTFDNTKVKVSKDGADFASGNTAHYGDKLVITAIEKTGYNRSLEVSGADSEDGGYTVKGNVSVAVIDTAKEYSLQTVPEGVTVKVSRDGAEVPVSAGEKIYYDEIITVTFENRVGFNRSITVNGATGGGTASGSKFTVTGNVEIILNEEYIEYRLTISNSSEGTVEVYNQTQGKSVQNGDTVHYGDKLQISYHESLGHSMSKFEVVGASQEAGVYTASGEITITYEEEYTTYSYDSFQLPNGVSVSRDGEPLNSGDTLTWGEQLTVTYTESEGKHKDTFTVNGTSRNNNFSFKFQGSLDVVYTEAINTYSVNYYDEDGSKLLYTETVEWGKDAKYSTEPSKAQDDEFTYAFDNWYTAKEGGTVANLKGIKAETNVYARYTPSRREYTITIPTSHFTVKRNGSALSSGDTIYYNDSLTITVTASTGYDFTSFKINGTKYEQASVTFVAKGNITISDYKETIKKFTVKFYDEDGVSELHTETVEWGKGSTYSTKPTKQSTETYDYTFSKWVTEKGGDSEADLTDIRENTNVYASYTEKYHEYTLTFDSELTVKKQGSDDALVSGQSTLHYGDTIVVTFQSKTGYNQSISKSGVSGTGTTSGSTFTVTGNVSLSYSESAKSFSLGTIPAGVTVQRGSSALSSNATIYYDEILSITYSLSAHKELVNFSVSGATNTSGNNYRVTGAVTITFSEEYVSYNLSIGSSNITVMRNGERVTAGTNKIKYNDVLTISYTETEGHHKTSFTINSTEQQSKSVSHTVTGAVTVGYTEAINTYSVKYYDEDGSKLLHTETVEWGKDAKYSTEPSKAQDDEFTYAFDNWYTAKEGGTVANLKGIKAETNVYARYTPSRREYTITIPTSHFTVKRNGSPLSSGDTIYYNDSLTITVTASTGYDFTSFKINGTKYEQASVTFVAKGNVTISDYAETIKKFTVKFYDEDGSSVLYQTTVEYNKGVTYQGTQPSKAQAYTNTTIITYTFDKWVTSKGGSEEADLDNIKSNLNVYAHFSESSTTRYYTVTFYDYDGTFLGSDSDIEYGGTASLGRTPTRASTNTTNYTFDKWVTTKGGSTTATLTNITANKSVYASYSESTRYYTVTFYDYDGSYLGADSYVTYNGTASYGKSNPTRADDGSYEYSFEYWASSKGGSNQVLLSGIKGDTNVYAYYSQTRYYTLSISSSIASHFTVKRSSTTLSSGSKIYSGDTLTITVTASEGYDISSYTINGSNYSSASKQITVSSSNVSITKYSETIKTFSVYFYNESGTTLLYTATVNWNTTATFGGTTPTKSQSMTNTEIISYTFDYWVTTANGSSRATLTNITANKSVYAHFSESASTRYYTVTFYDYDGSYLGADTDVTYNGTASYSGTPTRASTNTTNYTFDKWVTTKGGSTQASLSNITANKSVYAHYSESVRYYTVTFYDYDGSLLGSDSDIQYGGTASLGRTPTRASSTTTVYTFSKWVTTRGGSTTATLTNITANKSVYASYSESTRYYTVTFYDYDGSYLGADSYVTYNGTATYSGSTPTRASTTSGNTITDYTFDKWVTTKGGSVQASLSGITANKTVYAHYSTSTRTANYTVTFYNYDGTLLGTTSVAPGGTASYNGTPTRPDDANTEYSFDYWTDSKGGTTRASLSNINSAKSFYAHYTATSFWRLSIDRPSYYEVKRGTTKISDGTKLYNNDSLTIEVLETSSYYVESFKLDNRQYTWKDDPTIYLNVSKSNVTISSTMLKDNSDVFENQSSIFKLAPAEYMTDYIGREYYIRTESGIANDGDSIDHNYFIVRVNEGFPVLKSSGDLLNMDEVEMESFTDQFLDAIKNVRGDFVGVTKDGFVFKHRGGRVIIDSDIDDLFKIEGSSMYKSISNDSDEVLYSITLFRDEQPINNWSDVNIKVGVYPGFYGEFYRSNGNNLYTTDEDSISTFLDLLEGTLGTSLDGLIGFVSAPYMAGRGDGEERIYNLVSKFYEREGMNFPLNHIINVVAPGGNSFMDYLYGYALAKQNGSFNSYNQYYNYDDGSIVKFRDYINQYDVNFIFSGNSAVYPTSLNRGSDNIWGSSKYNGLVGGWFEGELSFHYGLETYETTIENGDTLPDGSVFYKLVVAPSMDYDYSDSDLPNLLIVDLFGNGNYDISYMDLELLNRFIDFTNRAVTAFDVTQKLDEFQIPYRWIKLRPNTTIDLTLYSAIAVFDDSGQVYDINSLIAGSYFLDELFIDNIYLNGNTISSNIFYFLNFGYAEADAFSDGRYNAADVYNNYLESRYGFKYWDLETEGDTPYVLYFPLYPKDYWRQI